MWDTSLISRFTISRGVRQGCPFSPFLFLLVTEFLNIFITRDFQGTFLISQLADHSCLFLNNEVPFVLEALKNILDASGGLTVNRNKSQIMFIHRLSLEKGHIEGIEIKSSVRYLGILISKSPKDRILFENSKSSS